METLDRPRIELYIQIILGIVLSIFPMTWWLKSALLFFMAGIFVDLAIRSPWTVRLGGEFKFGISLILLVVLSVVGAPPVFQQYRLEHPAQRPSSSQPKTSDLANGPLKSTTPSSDSASAITRRLSFPRPNLELSKVASLAEDAGLLSGQISICLSERGTLGNVDASSFCNEVYGSRLIDLRNELRNGGVSIQQLNAAVDAIRRGPSLAMSKLLDELSVKLAEMSRRSNPDQTGGRHSVPNEISIEISKPQLATNQILYLSQEAGRISGALSICLNGGPIESRANVCNAFYGTSVIDLRNVLRNAGVTSGSLEDAVQRIQADPDSEELQYIAKLLDVLSQKLGSYAKR